MVRMALLLLLVLASSTLVAIVEGASLLAVGDSLCTGMLSPPAVDESPIFFSNVGYADVIFAYLQGGKDSTTPDDGALTKVCCPGEDTHEYWDGNYMEEPSDSSFCYPSDAAGFVVSSQSVAALGVLQFDTDNDVSVITMSLGGNDFISCVLNPNPNATATESLDECLARRIPESFDNIKAIVESLQSATSMAYEDLVIMVMLPYNAFAAYYLSDDPLEQALAVLGEQVVASIALLKVDLDAMGVLVVESSVVFAGTPSDDTTLPPPEVVAICENTGMCFWNETSMAYELEPDGKIDIHPTVEGYQLLGQAHIDLLEQARMETMGPTMKPTVPMPMEPTASPNTSGTEEPSSSSSTSVAVAMVIVTMMTGLLSIVVEW